MKRFVAMILIVGIFLCGFPPFIVAGATVCEEVTREAAIAAFVTAVKHEDEAGGQAILGQFLDFSMISPEYREAVALAVRKGWICGYEDGSLRPQEAITGLEALVLLGRILCSKTLPQTTPQGFDDVPAWAEEEIAVLEAAGLVEGYGDGSLGAEAPLAQEQLVWLTERAVSLTGPRGDFYEYINENWLAETEIPFGQTAWSNLNIMQQRRSKEIGGIVYSLYRRRYKGQEVFPQGSSEQKIVDVFTACSNTAYRDRLGLMPVNEYLVMIDGATSMHDLLTVMAKLEYDGFHGLFPLSVTADIRDSSDHILTFSECYTGMDVLLWQSRDAARGEEAYRAYLQALFVLFGEEEAEAERHADAVTNLCRELAEASLPLEELGEIKHRHILDSKEELNRFFRQLDAEKYLKELGVSGEAKVLLYDLPLAQKIDSLWCSENLELLKQYLRASVMDGAAIYLNTDAFLIWRKYQDALNGVPSGALPADFAIQMVEEFLGWDLAKLYVSQYGSETEKEEIEEMTAQILAAYKHRLKNNGWMSEESKKTAIKKLDQMRIRVGYPENIGEYPDSAYTVKSIWEGGNLLTYRVDYCRRYMDTAVERLNHRASLSGDRWNILPQTVNALYEPSSNSITIPSGILDAPIYDSRSSFEKNLGGIGAVIAHEISHALDALGAQFDEKGNLADWWQEEDKKEFHALCTMVEQAYSAIEVLPDIRINGRQTLRENLADIAGMTCVLDVAGKDNPRLGDLFASYALAWRTKTTEGYLKHQLTTDTHAPDKVRVNRVLANFDEFIEWYQIQTGDGMYIATEERIRIW